MGVMRLSRIEDSKIDRPFRCRVIRDLVFLVIPSKSLEFHWLLFSIPTAPTIHLPDGWSLNKNMRGQKGAD
jgi:hypothetical protein